MNVRLTLVCLALTFCLAHARWPTRAPRPTHGPPPTHGPHPTHGPPPTHGPSPTHQPSPIPTGGPSTGQPGEGKLWALLVAGSAGWGNYRHQADVCHAYQILHAHGIPDENIVVMMVDDIANNQENPTKGKIINHPKGKDVYKGVVKDYVGDDVTPENFIKILTGDKAGMKGVGSGKVIDSGPNDHVFVNFVDHGATGLLGFPDGVLTVNQLNKALNKMFNEKRYGKLVLYVEACEAGSMFRDVLSDKINVFATTASDYDESSWGWYCDAELDTCLGDEYSINWMEDSDKQDIEKETLDGQFKTVKKVTTKSHPQEYGDLSIAKFVVGQFQGEKEAAPSPPLAKVESARGAPSREIPLEILHRKLTSAKTEEKKETIRKLIDELIEKRGHLETTVKKFVNRVSLSREHSEHLTLAHPQGLTNLECHDQLVKAFSQHCFNFGKNPYAMKYAYILANICEDGTLDTDNVISTMRQVCESVTIKENIE